MTLITFDDGPAPARIAAAILHRSQSSRVMPRLKPHRLAARWPSLRGIAGACINLGCIGAVLLAASCNGSPTPSNAAGGDRDVSPMAPTGSGTPDLPTPGASAEPLEGTVTTEGGPASSAQNAEAPVNPAPPLAGSEAAPGSSASTGDPTDEGPSELQLVEASVPELRRAIETRLVTPATLAGLYLARIAAYDDGGSELNAILALNPDATRDAEALGTRCESADAPPLCGIPVLIKDNVDAAGMPTTAGSVALATSLPDGDAFITRKLRDAGAIVLGKASLTEFANFLTTGMPSGYSSLGGYGLNPYDPRPQPGGDGRPALTPGGSSSGSAIAVSANFAAVAIGTETAGSILSPASSNGVVGIKPTLGLVSRSGILPISADQDTAGPIARSVRDAAILLGIIAGVDAEDEATSACLEPGRCFADYTAFLDPDALAGARIAVPPFPEQRSAIMEAAIDVLQAEGALVERVNGLGGQRGTCSAIPAPPGCSTVLLYGFKRDLNAYLGTISDAPVSSLAELIAFNADTPGALVYGQRLATAAEALDTSPGSADTQRYEDDRALDLQSSRAALDEIYRGDDGELGTEDDVDALLFSENTGAGAPAIAGYPSITVPGGFVPAAGVIQSRFPSGVTFSGPAFSEPRLIGLAFAFERSTQHREPPASTPALDGDLVRR